MQSAARVSAPLEVLRWHWCEAYEIAEALSVWWAVRRDNQGFLVAGSPDELLDVIRADYDRQPVPRP